MFVYLKSLICSHSFRYFYAEKTGLLNGVIEIYLQEWEQCIKCNKKQNKTIIKNMVTGD